MSPFDAAFSLVVSEEGDYSRNGADAGNWTSGRMGIGQLKGTKYGISAAAFPDLDIENLTLDQAKAIYKTHYWDFLGLDTAPWGTALLRFDAAVNQGQNWAKTLTGTDIEIAAARAVRYAQAGAFGSFGKGWMNRLFTMFKTAQVTPP